MSLEFFDSNCMLGTWKKNNGTSFKTAESLTGYLQTRNISRCLVYGSLAKFSDVMTGNNILLDIIKHDGRLHPCAVAIPHHTGEFPEPLAFCSYLAENNIRAVRIFPNFHGITLYDWLWRDLFTQLNKRRIPVFVDLSLKHWSDEVNWDQIRRICESFPDMPLIMVRLGVKADRYVYPLIQQLENLYIETSYYMVNDGLERFVDSFGSGRLIYGSGMPVYSPNPPMALIALSGISDNDKAAIAGKNLAGLLEGVDFHAE